MSYNNTSSSSNLLGLGNIVNKNTINKHINLKHVEMDQLSDRSNNTAIYNNQVEYSEEIYNKNIKEIANEIGIDIDNISTFLNDDNDDSDNNIRSMPIINTLINKKEPSQFDKESYTKKESPQFDKESYTKKESPQFDKESYISRVSNNNVRNDYPSLQQRHFDNNKSEQFRHDVFSNVLHNIKPNAEYTHDIYTEELKNKKSMLLEQIELLKLLLQEENENISNIPDLDENDSIDRLNHIYMILKIKKDRLQFDTMGNELIMFIVHLLEGFFDGERVFLGRYKPDLTGWHNSVGIKLRRMRYETSTVVSNIVQTYNINYTSRLAIELIPSLFLYSKVRAACANKKKYTKNEMTDNLSNIDI